MLKLHFLTTLVFVFIHSIFQLLLPKIKLWDVWQVIHLNSSFRDTLSYQCPSLATLIRIASVLIGSKKKKKIHFSSRYGKTEWRPLGDNVYDCRFSRAMPIKPARINFEVRRNFARPQSFMKAVTTLRVFGRKARNVQEAIVLQQEELPQEARRRNR